ncbi:hypothetical protein ScalyP_jg8641 [Parmales sp. scaly parma]|nr:hypothetical protein ScalyP_jg8641 [Parmales sp. scaly parma]
MIVRLGARSFAQHRALHLATQLYPNREPAPNTKIVLVLHGLLGNRGNFKTAAKAIVNSTVQPWNAIMMDIRGHGKSPINPKSENTIFDAGKDVFDTVQHLTNGRGVDMVIGHSLGGKVALAYLQEAMTMKSAHPPPKCTWVLDSIPGAIDRKKTSGSSSVRDVLNAVKNLPQPIASKKELIRALTEEKGIAMGIAMWMTTNLNRSKNGEGFVFTFDVETAEDLFDSFSSVNFFPFLHELNESSGKGKGKVEVHLLKAGLNDAWDDEAVKEELEKVEDGEVVRVHTLEKANHWVHVDNLSGLVDLIKPSLE